jgi:hypothetical protein
LRDKEQPEECSQIWMKQAFLWMDLFWYVWIWFGVVNYKSVFPNGALFSFALTGPNIPLHPFIFFLNYLAMIKL